MNERNCIIYDNQCPFCTRYVSLLRLREAVGGIRLIDARSGEPEVIAARRAGYDLDEGMLLVLDGQYHHGAECLNRLALLATPSGSFNRLNAWIFRHRALSRLLYPALRLGRNVTLRLLGRRRIIADG